MTETTALLPCPFCGAADPLVQDIPPHKHAFSVAALPDHPGSATVECPACDIGLIKPTRAEAIAAWNRRATPPALPSTAPAVAEGWRLVPVEPTPEMMSAASQYESKCAVLNYGAAPDAEGLYGAMIDAAPTATTPMQQVLHLARTVEEQVNAEGGEATVARIVALTIAAINAASQEPA